LFIVLVFCSTYYTASIARFRRDARDDIQRELVKTRLMSESESADWMNHFLDRFWLIYEPVLSKTVTATVGQILSMNCPTFLDSIRLTYFTLGTKAPRIDSVRTHPKTPDDIVMMDWAFSFKPTDHSDLTEKQAARIVNPKIIITVRLGAGLATAAAPILVEDISFSGLMRVRMKLMSNFPHIQLVDISFLEKPVFDYVLKPIGGDFGFDVGNIPGLSPFIRETVHSILGPMMYDPKFFTLNLEQLLSGVPLDTAIGVLQVTVRSARGIKGGKLGSGTPDPYVSISIENRVELAKTKYKNNTTNPSWNETKFLLINSLTETLSFKVMDYNDHRKDAELGIANFELSKLQEDATQEGLESTILKDGKDRGQLIYDMSFYPVLKPHVGAAGVEEVPETSVGIVRLTLHQAKELDNTKSLSGELNPYAKVYLGKSKHPIHKTALFKHTNDPVWESPAEFLCSDKASSTVSIKIIDDRDFLKDPVVGLMTIRLQDLLDAKKEAGRDWWPLSNCKSGKIRLSAEWKPIDMAGSLHGVDQYVPPIGVVKLWLKKAIDVKNVDAALGGKSDPYVRVQVNNVTQGRTEVVNNNLNPEWDQIIYVPVHSIKETMMLECMDYQHLTKDRSLGYVELKVADLAETGGGDHAYVSKGKKLASDSIRLEKGDHKGELVYEAEFIPAIQIKGLKFHGGLNEIQRAAKGGNDTDGETVPSESEDEDEIVNSAVTITNGTTNGARTHRKVKSTDTTATTATVDTTHTADSIISKPATGGDGTKEPGVEMSKEELLKTQSGVIIFNVLSGHLRKKARLEVLLDDGYWPAFSTIKARSTTAEWEHIGEGFVKELDFSRVYVRLNEADEGGKDDIIAEWKGNTKDLLSDALGEPHEFVLTDRDDPDEPSTVIIEARYVPVPVQLEPRESINNQGVVRVELLDGQGIHGADRGGKSDPFAVFELNGQRVHKSQTIKKTLTPVWNETFSVQVPSRVAANFTVEIFDWNQIEQAKSLGAAKIRLDDFEPFESIERSVSLSSDKHGEKGQIRVRLVFQPEMILKTRKNTSTFTTAGRAMTQIGHLPVGAGRGVMHGVTGVFRRDHAKSSSVGSESDSEDRLTGSVRSKKSVGDLRQKPSIGGLGNIPEIASGQASAPAAGGFATIVPDGAVGQANAQGVSGQFPQEAGTLRVTVVDAKDLSMNEIKPYVAVRVGEKEQKTKHVHKTANPDWNETFIYDAGPSQPKLYVWVYDHKTFGKDLVLGTGEVELWQHIRQGNSPVDVSVELTGGQGLLRLRMEFDPDQTPPRPSVSTLSLTDRSPASPSRFSLARRSKAQVRDD